MNYSLSKIEFRFQENKFFQYIFNNSRDYVDSALNPFPVPGKSNRDAANTHKPDCAMGIPTEPELDQKMSVIKKWTN